MKIRILIVDDNAEVNAIVQQWVVGRPYEVILCQSGKEAKQILLENNEKIYYQPSISLQRPFTTDSRRSSNRGSRTNLSVQIKNSPLRTKRSSFNASSITTTKSLVSPLPMMTPLSPLLVPGNMQNIGFAIFDIDQDPEQFNGNNHNSTTNGNDKSEKNEKTEKNDKKNRLRRTASLDVDSIRTTAGKPNSSNFPLSPRGINYPPPAFDRPNMKTVGPRRNSSRVRSVGSANTSAYASPMKPMSHKLAPDDQLKGHANASGPRSITVSSPPEGKEREREKERERDKEGSQAGSLSPLMAQSMRKLSSSVSGTGQHLYDLKASSSFTDTTRTPQLGKNRSSSNASTNLQVLAAALGSTNSLSPIADASENLVQGRAFTRNNFDMVLTEIELPDTSGGELLDWIKQQPGMEAINVVLMSSHQSAQAVARFIRRGCAEFIHKPLTRAVFLRTIRLLNELKHHVNNAIQMYSEGNSYKRRAKKKGVLTEALSFTNKRKPSLVNISEYTQHLQQNPGEFTYRPEEVHVLIVIDCDSTRAKVRAWCEGQLMTVTDACVGREALEFLVHESHGRDDVDLILYDAHMENLPPAQMLAGLKKHNLKIPVVLIYEDSMHDEAVYNAQSRGFETFLVKPLNPDFLFNKIRSVLAFVFQTRLSIKVAERLYRYKAMLEEDEERSARRRSTSAQTTSVTNKTSDGHASEA